MRRLFVLLLLVASAAAQQAPFFHIQPVRPVAGLRMEALAAQPPFEVGDFYKPDLVELVTLDPTIKLDIRYASSNNFLSTPMYDQARAFLQKPAAEALVRASKELHAHGYGILIHDGYRPWYVTKMFWDATPTDKHSFVADPTKGSNHNRGCAVDLTLYDLKTGKAVPMPGLYDEMSERSYPSYKGGTEEERRNRETLRAAMEKQGFAVYEFEWWHFDYKDWKRYPIMNVEFSQVPDPDFPQNPRPGIVEYEGHKYQRPQPVFTPEAEYSEQARQAKVDGTVSTWVFVGSDGKVKQAIVSKSAGYGLDQNAVHTIMGWKFKPAERDGVAIPVMVNVESKFRLNNAPKH